MTPRREVAQRMKTTHATKDGTRFQSEIAATSPRQRMSHHLLEDQKGGIVIRTLMKSLPECNLQCHQQEAHLVDALPWKGTERQIGTHGLKSNKRKPQWHGQKKQERAAHTTNNKAINRRGSQQTRISIQEGNRGDRYGTAHNSGKYIP
eukprot:5195017-Amphidinium_carterae.8